MDYYPTISGQKPKQTNKQKTLLTLTVSCEKGADKTEMIIIIIIIIKREKKEKQI